MRLPPPRFAWLASARTQSCRRASDISGLLSPASPRQEPDEADELPEDPGPIPDELLRIPGFVSEVMDICLDSAPYPNTVMAFSGALALQAFLAGRKVRDPGDNRTNIYLLGLAHSAAGKDWPRKIKSRIAHAAGLANCLGDRFASGEGVQDALLLSPSMLFQTDEIDGMLQVINKAKDARFENVMGTLLTLYSSSNSVFPHSSQGRPAAAGGDRSAEPRAVRHCHPEIITIRPSRTGCSPTASSRGRWSWKAESGAKGRNRSLSTCPSGSWPRPSGGRTFVLAAATWQTGIPSRSSSSTPTRPAACWSRPAERPRPSTRRPSTSGTRQHDRLGPRQRASAKTGFALRSQRGPCRATNQRRCGRLGIPRCHAPDARMLFMAAQHVSENPFHAECLKLIQKLREAPERRLPHSILLKRMKVDTKHFRELIVTLEQRGDIISTPVTTQGRTGLRVPAHAVKEGERSERSYGIEACRR